MRLLAAVLLYLAAGCTPAGLLAQKFIGPMPVEARYVPEKRPTLVLIERYGQPTRSTLEAEILAREVYRELNQRQLVPQVDPGGVFELRTRDSTKFRTMTISQIGSTLGAEQVLYVNVLEASLQMSEGSQLLRGAIAARVKFVDVATGHTMWPGDADDGYPVAVQTPIKQVEEGTNPETARFRLMRQMANAIVRNFYKWKPDETDMDE